MDAVAAAFDPDDDFSGPPRQSVSEQQVPVNISSVHGLTVWTSLLRQVIRLFDGEHNVHVTPFQIFRATNRESCE